MAAILEAMSYTSSQFRAFLLKKLYKLCVILSWLILAWGLVGNIAFLRYSVVSNYISSMKPKEPPIRTIADQFFRLETVDKLTREAFVSVLEKNVHLFSAVGHNSSSTKYYDNIVLSGWEKHTLNISNNYTCCFIYNVSSPQILATRMIEKKDWLYLGRVKLEVKQFVCPNVLQNNRKVPSSVSLGVGKVCPKTMNTYARVDLPVKQAGDNLAVCAKLVFGNISASAVVEWFEYQRLMNVSKVLAYVSKLNADATKVLQYYVSKGLAELYQFSLPQKDELKRDVDVKKFQSWNDEQITVFDCAIRLAGYKYIGLYDLDEFIYPKKGKSLTELIRTLRLHVPNVAGFTFKTEVYPNTWGKVDNNSKSLAGLMINSYALRTDPMIDRVKSIVITDRIHPDRLSTHGYWPKSGYRKNIPTEYATTKHFRSCRKEWLRKGGAKCYKLIRRINVESLFDVTEKIRDRVKTVKQILKLT